MMRMCKRKGEEGTGRWKNLNNQVYQYLKFSPKVLEWSNWGEMDKSVA